MCGELFVCVCVCVQVCVHACVKGLQGRQRHRKGGTAHNRSAPPKAVPGGAPCVCRGDKRQSVCVKRSSVRAKRGKKIFACIFSDEEALSCIQTAVLGKKRPWLVWSINGRPRTKTRNRCQCRVCVINYQVGSKSGPAKAGPAGPAAPPLG